MNNLEHKQDLNIKLFRQIFYLTLAIRREWFLPTLYELEASQYWPTEELEKLQVEKLTALLKHARKNIVYYREILPSRVDNLDDIKKFPLLDKNIIREHYDLFKWSGGVYQRVKTSGGSTGAPVTLLKDSHGMANEMAAAWRAYRWAGIDIGSRQVRLWGVPRNGKDNIRSKLIDFVCNRKRISAFNFDDETILSSFKKLTKFRPNYIYGYTSIIKEFSDFIVKENIQLKSPLSSIITTSEVLTSSDRSNIERAFGAKVFDEYGSGEVGTIAHECEFKHLHINSENLIVEILDEEGEPVPAGNSGQIVVTDLTNLSMPLIRYRLKDWGALSKEVCPCGRTLPVLEGVYGRQYDILKNSKGRNFHGEFFLYIAEDAKKQGIAVDGIQVIQEADLSLLILLQCRPEVYVQIESFFSKRLREGFDKNLKLNFKRVDIIKREPSGKLRVVKKQGSP